LGEASDPPGLVAARWLATTEAAESKMAAGYSQGLEKELTRLKGMIRHHWAGEDGCDGKKSRAVARE